MLIADKTLFAFVDPKDPFAPTEIAGGDQSGPILSILASRPFDQVFLFHTPHTRTNALATHDEIARRFPRFITALHELPVSDPKDYSSLMGSLSRVIAKVRRQLSRESQNYVCVSSGTAEMRAAWFVLTASGFLPGTMLQIGSPIEPLFGAANVKEVSFDEDDWRNLADLVMPQEFFGRREEQLSIGHISDCYAQMDLGGTDLPDIDAVLQELNMFIGSAVMREAVERAAIAAADGEVPILLNR